VNVTEVRIKLADDPTERLRAFCSITIDNDFVIRDIKIIEGPNGTFVAMPSRKLMDHCRRCSGKNHLRARHCNDCGTRLDEGRAPMDERGRAKLHADVAHPITAECRESLQDRILAAFEEEMKQAKDSGYEPKDFGDLDAEQTEKPSEPSHGDPSISPSGPAEGRSTRGDRGSRKFGEGIFSD